LGGQIFRDKPAAVSPLLFCFVGGYLSIQPWLGIALPDNHVSQFAESGRWQIEGVVASHPLHRHGRWQFILSVNRLENPRKVHRVCGLVKVTGRGNFVAVIAGDAVSLEGRIRSIRNFANPGGFDYQRHMAMKAVRARVYARSGSLHCRTRARTHGFGTTVDGIRQCLADRMETALSDFSEDTVTLLRLIVLGDRTGLTPELRNAFNRAGVGHILAISGLHVGMVAACLFCAARWILSWFPIVLKHAWAGKGAALIGLLGVAGYGVLAGLSASTQRAMIMAAVFLVRFWVGRRYDWFNALAAAALTIMVIYPPAVLGVSFQLSFAAVLALIAGASAITRPDTGDSPSLRRRICRRMAAYIWISVLAILGTLPLVLHYFNQVSLVGLAANLVAVPLVGMVILPLGLAGLAGAAMGLWALPAQCWQAAAMAMDLVRFLVEGLGRWPLAAVQCVTPTGLEIGLYYLLGMMVLFWRRLPWRTPLVLTVLSVGLLDVGYWTYQRFGRTDVRVTVLDVGQGSANLIQFPGGYTVLVDGGGFSDNRLFDVGMRIVAPVLWRNKIKTLDLVVLSHPNSDHLNGLIYILEHFKVRQVWDNGEIVPTAGCKRWHRLIAEKGIDHPDFSDIPRHQVVRGVQIDILSPPVEFLKRCAFEPWRDENNNSLVLKVHYGSSSILFTGDIGARAEAEMVRNCGTDRLQSTVLIAPHHGSGGSSSNRFVHAVRPEHTVISCGWMNRFGFPHPTVIQRLNASHSRIWVTADCGAVQIVLDGKSHRVNPLK
jgi:competence protein ComEC